MTETPSAKTSQELQVSQNESQAGTPLLEADYEAIAAAVMETDRGRWFLQEYARRNRNADTQTVLTAIDKLEKRLSENEHSPKEATSVALLSHDLIDLAGAISQVKKEVAELGGQGNDPDHFNTATVELEAIVEQTESATSEILEAAEKIQEVTWLLREEGASETQCDIIESKIVEVYTACSFQDLTGQRSNKVVQLVGYIERRIASMMSILGLSDDDVEAAPPTRSKDDPLGGSAPGLTPKQREDSRPDAELLNGPAMQGEGNEQGEVDALFDEVVFNDKPEFGSDDIDSDDVASDADVEPSPVTTSDAQDSSVADEQTVDEDDFEFRTIDPSAEEVEVEDETDIVAAVSNNEEAADDVAAELAQPVDFGEDDESANTPEAADVFGFDVEDDGKLIEIQDAEILAQSAEETADDTAPETEAKQDIFEVDPLSFGGKMIGETDASEIDKSLEAEMDGAPKMVVGLPGDFDVDSHVADMFVSSGETEPENTSPAGEQDQELVDGQDIFEAESIDIGIDGPDHDVIDIEAVDTSQSASEMTAEPVSGPEDHDVISQHPQSDAVAEGLDDLIVQESDIDTTNAADADADVVDSAIDMMDEDTIDDAFATLEADAAVELEAVSAETSSTPDLDSIEAAEPDQSAPTNDVDAALAEMAKTDSAADQLMEEVLAVTETAGEETDYPDDEYTVEERIALFS